MDRYVGVGSEKVVSVVVVVVVVGTKGREGGALCMSVHRKFKPTKVLKRPPSDVSPLACPDASYCTRLASISAVGTRVRDMCGKLFLGRR